MAAHKATEANRTTDAADTRVGTGWRTIETAPKDGTPVMLKRLYKGRIVAEGPGVFGILHEAAPSRRGPGIDPLGRLTAADYAEEARDREEFIRTAKWLIPNRMYLFPTPTHWMPLPAPP